jgi:PEP-CTERM motif
LAFLVGMNRPRHILFLAAATALLPVSASAAFVLFDNFDSYPAGPLNGQGPAGNLWTAQAGATVANSGGSDNVVNFAIPANAIPNSRSLTPAGLAIPNASAAATVYWNFTISAVGGGAGSPNNWNFVITDVALPPDTAGSSEVQFNYDSTASPLGLFRARNAGAFPLLSTTQDATGNILPLANAQYNVWFEINNSTDTYKIFMQSDSTPALAAPTQVFANDGTTGAGGNFGFRNGAAANDLITANIGSASPGSVVRMDDIYVDLAAFNTANPVPVIPEPGAFALVGLGMFGLMVLRRRSNR